MAYLVLAYPNIEQSDYDWVQSIRQKHDKRYFNIVKPHVTLVFSTSKLSLSEFTQHIKEKVGAFQSFELNLDSVKVVEDDSKEFFHVFLIPSKGFNEINKIHDELYTDKLEGELRHDIPFIPHVGVGTSDSLQEANEVASDIEKARRPIIGNISQLTIVEFDGKKVVNLETISLSEV